MGVCWDLWRAAWLTPGLLAAAGSTVAHAAPVSAATAVLPIPASIEPLSGSYVPDRRTVINVPSGASPALRNLADDAAKLLGSAWNRPVGVIKGPTPQGAIRLSLTAKPVASPDSYHLLITPSRIDLSAPSSGGLFYGLQTLRQLAEQAGPEGIAAAEIEDQPRFKWRGLMLDSARHMMPVSYIKNQLDLMARYKFNRFHWHLTDDQGWRIEIKHYPKLTSIGAWRDETIVGHQDDPPFTFDHTRYGGFYTQAQIRDVVAYARARHIEVVPEIDMPGHMVAALASYPELGCTHGPFKVREIWGVADDVLCPSPTTIAFVKNVLVEVMQLFPSRYIHLGGDEAPIVRWQHSALVQSLMRRKGLANEHAVQGWFLQQIEQFVEAHGRKVIGWDEILDGRPSPSATVMSWRGMSGGITAARRGHDVIMSPTDYVYLDYCQGKTANEPLCNGGNIPLRRVYDFEPVPSSLTPSDAKHILGGQGNLWTEYLPTTSSVEYMLWPRGLALAEVLWSPKQSRDWSAFKARAAVQLTALDRLGVNYRIPEVEGLDHDVLSLQPTATLRLHTMLPQATIRYTLDGTTPGFQSSVYRAPVQLRLTPAGTLVIARSFVGSRASPITSARFKLAHLQPPVAISRQSGKGLRRRYFQAAVDKVGELDGLTPARTDVATDVGLPEGPNPETFGLVFDGYIRVPVDGVYTFVLRSDDGSDLHIGSEQVISRDGPQSPGDTAGSIALAAGLHPMTLRYFQAGGGAALKLMVSRNGGQPEEVPADWWVQP